jgi:hypothetical protein
MQPRFGKPCLPDAANAEDIEFGIDADNGNVERKGLSCNHAVEGVFVFAKESACKESGLNRKVNEFEARQ